MPLSLSIRISSISVCCFILILQVSRIFAQLPEPVIKTFNDSRNAQPNYLTDDADGESSRFARWEYRMVPRLRKGGVFPQADILLDELSRYYGQRSNGQTPQGIGGGWLPLGPLSFDAPGSNNGGMGRINVIRFHPFDTAIIFVGTPDGGLWKTTDEGNSWTPMTDRIPSLGVTDIAIDPKYPDTMYLATGDARAAAMYGNPYSYGILKTTNGGSSWSQSGLEYDLPERILIQRIVVSPANSNVLLAAVYGGDNRGIHKSTDGGASWSKKDGGAIYDIVYNPADPSMVYASGYGNFRRSTNGGDTWTGITGLPTWQADGVSRTAIAVTPADPNVVYVIYISHNKNQIYGLYKSTDKGLTFTQMIDTTKNLPFGNYGEYNLVLAVSPTDPNIVVVGEQLLAKSTNGGQSWRSIGTGIHVDNHAFVFAPHSGSVCYSGNDGGIYRSTNTGTTWKDLSAGLQITQYYRLGSAMQRSALLYSGAQDNGIHRYDNNIWSHAFSGADGGECLVDYSDANIMYMEFQNGYMMRSDDGGYSSSMIAPDQNGHWITPYLIHPKRPATIYTAFRNVFRSDDRGDSWEALSPALANNDNIKSLALAPSNDHVIYAGTYIRLFRTTDEGGSWADITAGSPTGDTAALTSICVSPTDPKKVWLTFSGFTDHKHVYRSSDGGDTWINVTGSLPNVPVNTTVYEQGSNDAIYIGTDVGVFYRDKSMSDWEPFMNGLPNVSISELEVHEASGVIRAATFGRGVWESPLRSLLPPMAPILSFPADDTVGVVSEPIFAWQKLPRTRNYRMQLSTDSLFSRLAWNVVSLDPDTVLSAIKPLEPGTRYFWHVSFVNAAGQGPWSQTWSFTTAGQNRVDDLSSKEDFKVHPNPSSGKVTIVSGIPAGKVSLEIVDRAGRICSKVIVEFDGSNSHVDLDLADLPTGAYFARVTGEKLAKVIPFVLEK